MYNGIRYPLVYKYAFILARAAFTRKSNGYHPKPLYRNLIFNVMRQSAPMIW